MRDSCTVQADIPKEGISKPGANPGAIGPSELLDVKVPAPKRVRIPFYCSSVLRRHMPSTCMATVRRKCRNQRSDPPALPVACWPHAAIKDPKAIWDDDEVTDAVEDDIDDGRIVPVYEFMYKQVSWTLVS